MVVLTVVPLAAQMELRMAVPLAAQLDIVMVVQSVDRKVVQMEIEKAVVLVVMKVALKDF